MMPGRLVECAAEDGFMVVATCRDCHVTFRSPKITQKQYDDIVLHGKHVQDVLPYWSPAEREMFFISGTCDDCWKKMFGRFDWDSEPAEDGDDKGE